MRKDTGITLTSLLIYIIVMTIVIGVIASISTFFYHNVDTIAQDTDNSKEFTKFNSYFTQEVNETNNKPVKTGINGDQHYLLLSNGNQYTFVNGAIYLNKIRICKNIKQCTFNIDTENNRVTVNFIADDNFEKTTTYTFNRNW